MRAEMGPEPLEISGDEWAHVRIHDDGAGALVFTDLTRQCSGGRHEHVGTARANLSSCGDLVFRVDVRVEEGDGHGRDIVRETIDRRPQAVEVELVQLVATCIQTLAHLDPQRSRHRAHPWPEEEVVHVGAVLTPHLEDIAEALGREQRRFHSGLLEHGIDGNR